MVTRGAVAEMIISLIMLYNSALFLKKLGVVIANQECVENQNEPADD